MTKWIDNIEKISYGDALYYDSVSGFPIAAVSDNFPIGTKDNPCNNFADLLTLATNTGIKKIIVLVSTSLDVTIAPGLTIEGATDDIQIDLNSQVIDGVTFQNCTVTGIQGTAANYAHIKDCTIWDIDDAYLWCSNVRAYGTITPAASGSFIAFDFSVLEVACDFDMVNAAQVLIQKFSGKAAILNNSVGGHVIITGNGHISADSSNGGGVLGIGGTISLDNTSLMTISDSTEVAALKSEASTLYYSSTGAGGTNWPVIGTMANPSNSFDDLITISNFAGINKIVSLTDLDLSTALVGTTVTQGLTLIAANPHLVLTLGGKIIDGVTFKNFAVTGAQGVGSISGADKATFWECWLNGITSTFADLVHCAVVNIDFRDGFPYNAIDIYSLNEMAVFYVTNPNNLVIEGFNGHAHINGLTSGIVSIDMVAGSIVIDGTCTGGTINVTGVGKVSDAPVGVTLVDATIDAQIGPYLGDHGVAINSNVKAELDIIDSKVDSVGTQVSVVDSKVDSVGVQVSVVDSKVDSVGSQVDSVGTQVSVVDSKVDSVGAQVASVASDVSTVISKVDSVGSQVDSAVSDIESVTISAIDSAVSDIDSTTISAVDSAISDIDSTVISTATITDSKVDSVGNGTDLSVISTAISTIDTEVETTSLGIGGGSNAANARAGSLARWTADAIAGITGTNSYQESVPNSVFTLAAIDTSYGANPPGEDVANQVVHLAESPGINYVLRSLWINTTSFGTGTQITYDLWVVDTAAGTVYNIHSAVVNSLGWQTLTDLFGLSEVCADAIFITAITDAGNTGACSGSYHYATAV